MERTASSGRNAAAIALALVSALALIAAAASAFRLRPAEALGFAFAIQGPRLLLAAAVGAALAASASLARERGRDLLARELALFGVAAFGVLGGGLTGARFGASLAPLGAVLGAALGGGLLHALYRLPRAALAVLGVAYPLTWYACLHGAAYAKGTLDSGARARLAWWAGDLAHAGWLSAGVIAIAVAALLGVALFSAARADRRIALEIALLGLAVGAAGPIAFVGSFGVLLASLAAREDAARTRLGLAALASGGGLALADAVQRIVLGGYALPLNTVTGFVALPVVYVACVRTKQRAEGRSRPWLGALESLLVLVTSAFGYYVLYRVALVIHGAA